MEGLPHRLEVLTLDVLPFAEVGILHLFGDDPVDHHGVDPIAKQRQVRVGPLGLRDHHLLRVHHQPDRGHPVVGEELADAVQVAMQAFDRGEDPVVGDGHGRQPGEQRPDRLHHPSLHREDPLDVPVHGLGQREQPKGLRGGSAVHHQQVETPAVYVGLDVGEAEDLVQAGDHRELLGLDRVDPRPVQERDHELLDVAPVGLQPVLRVDLLGPQVRRDLLGAGGEGDIERVGEGVRRVCAHDERAVACHGSSHCSGRSDGCLADPALAGEQKNPHPRNSLAVGRLHRLPDR